MASQKLSPDEKTEISANLRLATDRLTDTDQLLIREYNSREKVSVELECLK